MVCLVTCILAISKTSQFVLFCLEIFKTSQFVLFCLTIVKSSQFVSLSLSLSLLPIRAFQMFVLEYLREVKSCDLQNKQN